TAAVHDTLLNDLAVVMNAPDRLAPHVRQRLLADLETLRSADWISATATAEVPSEGEAELRNNLVRLSSEFQWSGLSLHITGVPEANYRVSSPVARALIGAVRAALDNVVRHSGATTAELEIMSSP